ncbi:MAG: hypothetical protein OEZ02_08625 [Anaerolineae bacterium]|nr:hypothetical protein [Anaerolineae bacterium]
MDELAVVLTGFGVAHLPTTAVAGDMTGDTKDEIVVAIQDPAAQKVPSPGALLVYTCQGERFALAQIVLSQEFLSAPMIIHMQDLNADRRQELIYSSSSCGAHTCFEAVQILGWTGSAFENLLDGGTDDLPAPNMQITDYDLDGVYDLEVVGNGFGSVGAGPQRQVTRIWRYDPESGRWKIADESTGASNYRIHALHDADTTLRRGDYQIAIVLYNQVIHDDALLDWADKDNERLNLSAFAHFKTIVAYAFMDNLEQALEFFQSMSAAFPTGPQRSYVDLAQAFLNAFTAAGREAGCAAAHTFARENESRILAPLGSAVFGYANPDYAPEDVCP